MGQVPGSDRYPRPEWYPWGMDSFLKLMISVRNPCYRAPPDTPNTSPDTQNTSPDTQRQIQKLKIQIQTPKIQVQAHKIQVQLPKIQVCCLVWCIYVWILQKSKNIADSHQVYIPIGPVWGPVWALSSCKPRHPGLGTGMHRQMPNDSTDNTWGCALSCFLWRLWVSSNLQLQPNPQIYNLCV